MSQINVRNLSNENDDGAPDIVGVSTFSATSYFVPPKGTTEQRPTNPQNGDLRFNTDTASLEYFRGDTLNWSQIEMTSPDLNGGARGIFVGGQTPSNSDVIEYVTISTLGNATDFGNQTTGLSNIATAGSRTRGIIAGGEPATDLIQYITFSSTGNATDFGADLTASTRGAAGASSETRMLIAGGYAPAPTRVNTIQYITIASTGTAAADFGDLTNDVRLFNAGQQVQSSTRAVFGGGSNPSGNGATNHIEYSTISTLGNTTDFGDMATSGMTQKTVSNSTRGVWGGFLTPSVINTIEYVTTATTGNAADFGDLSETRANLGGSASSPTRGLFRGGQTPTKVNTIDYITILTTGNATDFGDSTETATEGGGTSNAHGGL